MSKEKIKIAYHCKECNRSIITWVPRKTGKLVGKCYYCEILYEEPEQDLASHVIPKGFKKRSVKRDDIIDRETLLKLLHDLKDKVFPYTKYDGVERFRFYGPKEIAFFALLYITGSRISEICRYQDRYNPEIKLFGPRRRDFDIAEFKDNEGKLRWWLSINGLKILKTRNDGVMMRRDIKVSYDKDGEFIELLEPYLNSLQPNDILFNWSASVASSLFEPISSHVWPHALRALRTYDLKRLYGWTQDEITRFVGWQNNNTIRNYLKLTSLDLVQQTKF